MKTKVEKLPKSQIKLKIELSEDEFSKFRQSAFLRLSSQADIKGFRPGKAPEDLQKDRIGKDKIFQEALEMCLPQTYFNALKENNITPVADPEIKIKKYEDDKPLKFSAQVDILPDFQLPNYHQVKLKAKKIKVGPKEIQGSLESLQKSYAKYEDKKEASQKRDKVEIDFEGYIKGVKIDQLVSKNHPLVLGEGNFVPGFEDKLIGLKKGEKKEFSLKMPTKLRDKFIAGKQVKFRVKMNRVQKVILPKLDDEFAKKITKDKNLEQLKAELKKTLEKRTKLGEQRRLEVELLNKLSKKTDIDLPESLVKNEQFRMFVDIQKDIESKGIPFSKYLESIGKNDEEFLKGLREQAEKAVKIGLIIGKIKQKEKVKVDENEVEEELNLLKRSGYQIEDEKQARQKIQITLENQKILKKLVDRAIRK